MNKVQLVGRLTKDPEIKNTAAQVNFCNFTVAVDRRFKDQNGQRQADFINCVAWRQTADFIGKYFRKGSRIAICGTIQTRKFDDQNGVTRYVTEVIAEEAEFVESLNQSAPAPAPAAPEPPKTDTSKILERIQEQKTFEEELEKLDDLDLPFQF